MSNFKGRLDWFMKQPSVYPKYMVLTVLALNMAVDYKLWNDNQGIRQAAKEVLDRNRRLERENGSLQDVIESQKKVITSTEELSDLYRNHLIQRDKDDQARSDQEIKKIETDSREFEAFNKARLAFTKSEDAAAKRAAYLSKCLTFELKKPVSVVFRGYPAADLVSAKTLAADPSEADSNIVYFGFGTYDVKVSDHDTAEVLLTPSIRPFVVKASDSDFKNLFFTLTDCNRDMSTESMGTQPSTPDTTQSNQTDKKAPQP